MAFEPARINYVLQSQNISTAAAFTTGWVGTSATTTTVTGGPTGEQYAEITNTVNTGRAETSSLTVPSSSTFAGYVTVVRGSGSGPAGVATSCWPGSPTTCSCSTGDGTSCTASVVSTSFCLATVANVTTTPVVIRSVATCSAPITSAFLWLIPSTFGLTTGTARFTKAQIEVGLSHTGYTPTTTVAVGHSARAWR